MSLLGTVGAILSLLIGFSIAFGHSVRARRRSQREASTDASDRARQPPQAVRRPGTGCGVACRRRQITSGSSTSTGSRPTTTPSATRPATRSSPASATGSSTAVGGRGQRYRIGGDEFVVTTTADRRACGCSAAQAALTDNGRGFSIGCSTRLDRHPGRQSHSTRRSTSPTTPLHATSAQAQSERRSEVTDALLQVLAEQDQSLVTHLGHVAALADRTPRSASACQPSKSTLTRLAAELHDIGKAAIPDVDPQQARPARPGRTSIHADATA